MIEGPCAVGHAASERTQRDSAIAIVMRASFTLSDRTYGARCILRYVRAEGFVLDLFSRRVVGWSMQATMTAQLVAGTFLMAAWRRGTPPSELAHSDQGSQGGFNRSSRHPVS